MPKIEGTVSLLGQQTNYEVEAVSDSSRRLVLQRGGFTPDDIVQLLSSFAPGGFVSVTGIKQELEAAHDNLGYQGTNPTVVKAYTSQYGQSWDNFQQQAELLHDSLPLAGSGNRHWYGERTLRQALQKVKDRSLKQNAFQVLNNPDTTPEQFEEHVAGQFQVQGDAVLVPNAPVVRVPDQQCAPTFIPSQSIRLTEGAGHDNRVAVSNVQRVNDTAYAHAVHLQDQLNRVVPLWDTARDGIHDTTAVINWTLENNQAAFVHTEPETVVGNGGFGRQHYSSVVGNLVLGAIAREAGDISTSPDIAADRRFPMVWQLKPYLDVMMQTPDIMRGTFICAIEEQLQPEPTRNLPSAG